MKSLRRIDMVVVPLRGKPRVYAIGPLTVGPQAFQLYERMISHFERWSKRHTLPLPRRQIECLSSKTNAL